MMERVQQAVNKNTQTPECGWAGRGDNNLYYLTIKAPAIAGVQCQADYLVKLPAPFRKFLLVSVTTAANNNSLFLHLQPLGKQYPIGISAITPDGTENWLSMKMKSAADTQGVMWAFKSGVDVIYFDWGYEAGGGISYAFTLACSNDAEFDFRPFNQIGII